MMGSLPHYLKQYKRITAALVTTALALGLFFGLSSAHAQQQDSVLQSYSLAAENLDEALISLPTDGALSREALDRAAQTLRPLSRDVVSASLIGALESTFTRAAVAVQNQSATDLAVQVAVLRGGFQRLVYESALRAANEGDLELARERLLALARDIGFADEVQGAMSAAGDYTTLNVAFDQGVAQAVQRDLANASEQLGSNQGSTYINVAEAYGTFLTVQDSPRVATTANGTFTQTFVALVGTQEGETVGETSDPAGNPATAPLLLELSQTMAQFEERARATLAGESVALPAAALPEPAEGATAGETVSVEPAPTASEAASLGIAPSDAAPSDAAEPTAATPDAAALVTTPGTELEPSQDALSGITNTATDPAAPTSDGVTLAQSSAPSPTPSQALEGAFSDYDVSAERRSQLAQAYRTEDVTSVEGAVAALYAEAGRTLVAVETGNLSAVDEHLRAYDRVYTQLLSPLVAERSSTVDDATSRLTRSLQASPSLRLQDAAVLVGQVDSVAAALTGAAPSGTHQALLATSVVWSGWLRTLVVLLLGVLAFVPLWLLNLAFGGANRNWRLIGAALFLLLLPIMFEGVSSLGALLSAATGVQALNILSVFSIFQNTLSQVVWVVLTALAIGLASAGLYGICVQFGLLGTPPATTETLVGTHDTGMQLTGESAVDWDEEF